MPVEVFPEDLLAFTHTEINDADTIKTDIDLLAETWVAIDEATPYSVEKFAFTYTEIDDVIPTNIDIFAKTWTQIDDTVWGEYLDVFFEMGVVWYEDTNFYMDTERYLDIEFNFLTAEIEFEDINFYMDTERYLDVSFDFAVYDFEDWSFYMDTERYLDIDFYVGIGGIIEVDFLTYVPLHNEYEFIAAIAQYSDVDIHIPMWHYFTEFDFRMKHIPTYLGYIDHSFITKVTQYMEFDVELISLYRQLPATIIIRGTLR